MSGAHWQSHGGIDTVKSASCTCTASVLHGMWCCCAARQTFCYRGWACSCPKQQCCSRRIVGVALKITDAIIVAHAPTVREILTMACIVVVKAHSFPMRCRYVYDRKAEPALGNIIGEWFTRKFHNAKTLVSSPTFHASGALRLMPKLYVTWPSPRSWRSSEVLQPIHCVVYGCGVFQLWQH